MPKSEYKSYLLRMHKRTLDALQAWARDDLRSLNSQIEWLLREALRKNGRSATPDKKR